MAVKYRSIDGELVSEHWFAFLSAARKDGVRFEINEGHRTLARQWYFYNCWRTKRCNNGNLAAYPSRNAPHIRTGRQDHAIDSDELQALIDYGRKVGVTILRTVRSESWHGEARASELAAFYKKARVENRYGVLAKDERSDVYKLFYHRKKMYQHSTGKLKSERLYRNHLSWARWYKNKLRVRANLLYRLGKRQGWKKLDRGERQLVLRAIINDGSRIE